MFGVAFALGALLSWGLGDFLIQRSARKFGDWVPLACITLFAAIALLPFVWHELPAVFSDSSGLVVLVVTSIVITGAALVDFEALRVGKISVIEPIYALEVPVTVTLASVFLAEHLTALQTMLIVLLMVGIFLVATRSFHHLKRVHTERGVWLAVLATLGMGTVNFLFGVGAREVSPLVVNWFTSTFIAAICLVYLLSSGRIREVWADVRHRPALLVSVSVVDNLAWVCYSYATLFVPIAIATGISESYIALAAALGLVVNREQLNRHQLVGIVVVLVAVVALVWVSGG
jgi:drug/metabolite transporter (DMT)-like permease